MISREDLMDDEDHLLAPDLLYAEDLAERFLERDTRELAERAAADRDWTYRHVVVDEAQELSAMDWRVLMRRCPSRSFTIVGDLAQRRSAAGATSWDTMLEPVCPRPLGLSVPDGELPHPGGDHGGRRRGARRVRTRRPAAGFGAVLRCAPWSRRITADELPAAIEEFVRSEAGREGTSIVIGPPGVPGTVPASETKGLEFDAVLVVDPSESSPTDHGAPPNSMSRSPARPSVSVSCTRARCPSRCVDSPRSNRQNSCRRSDFSMYVSCENRCGTTAQK